jgi:hypothetical protein
MAWESRNGRGAYYTRSRRCDGTVIREYIGFDETAKVIAKIDDIERQVRKEEIVAQREVRAELDEIDTHAEQLAYLGGDSRFFELLPGTDFANSNSSIRPQYSRPLDRSACRQRTWLPPARGPSLLEGSASVPRTLCTLERPAPHALFTVASE